MKSIQPDPPRPVWRFPAPDQQGGAPAGRNVNVSIRYSRTFSVARNIGARLSLPRSTRSLLSILAVVARSESFSALWPQLAAGVDARAVIAESAGELGPAGDAVAVVLSVAGVEEEAGAEGAAG